MREAYDVIKKRFAKRKITLHLVSAATGEGVRELSVALYRLVTGHGVRGPGSLPRAPQSEPDTTPPDRAEAPNAESEGEGEGGPQEEGGSEEKGGPEEEGDRACEEKGDTEGSANEERCPYAGRGQDEEGEEEDVAPRVSA